ncbi:MAG TPA: DUF2231 domain-containing protein [Chthoniobacter sp.]|jgi:uncharacterized membrane protein
MKFFVPLFVLLLALAGSVLAADDNAEGVKEAGKVREIFEAKCLDCHGPELPRPKGKFGYVLDLKRVADNPDYIERGKPDKSDLYNMILDDEMPGEDANVPPLTKDEKEIVKHWIELGAPEPSLTAGESSTTTVAKATETRLQMPFWKKALRYVGRLHPVSTHFPVALMFVAVFAEGLAWWTRRESWMQTIRFLVVLAALGALAAAVLGWINAYFASYTGQLAPILKWHRWLGTSTALWAVVCAVLVMINECREGSTERQRFRGALLLGAALVGISGFLGSALIYGLDHYAWN